MSDIAIRVENLGKIYRLGQTVGYKTLRESLTNAITAPFRRVRSIRRESSGTNPQPQATDHDQLTSKQRTGYIWALKDISFEVKRGEAIGIIGRNGSGKSTLLKILSRITTPTEGYAEIHGRAGSLLEVGTGFHPELTGRENIYLNGAILGLKKAEIERKFDEIVAFSEIGQFLDTPVKRYSSGMYVRLAFAVAAHLEPDILLVDEVLAVGDTAFQKKCLGKMGDVTREGRTVLFISHNMAAVEELCPRAILLSNGRLVEDGLTRDVISNYLSSQSLVSIGDMDVTDPALRRNSLPNSRFRWTRVTILNSAGKATALLAFGEPFDIILQGIADRDLSEVRVGFSIDSVLGPAIFNSYQIDQGLPDRLPVGNIRFRIRMEPNLLAPGLYQMSLGSNGNGVLDFLPVTLQFTISAAGEGTNRWRSYHGGLIRYPCKWSMESGG
jgi:lipopolysaccharide transport system ATP-binding protein